MRVCGNMGVMRAGSNLEAVVRDKAFDLGFDAVGVARGDAMLGQDFTHYEAFLDASMHGQMHYLANSRQVRQRVNHPDMLAGARSVICVMKRYGIKEQGAGEVVDAIAYYARGKDYHRHVRSGVRALAQFVRSLAPGVVARPVIDTAPVLERAWAVRAGLGFIGKNGMLIRPGCGSFTVLGEVITSLELTPDRPMEGGCGRCSACVASCPTRAIVSPYVVDARKCISYLTIEHKGPWQSGVARCVAPRIFGCDVCQRVCPYNRSKGAWIGADEGVGDSSFAVLARWKGVTRAQALRWSLGEFVEMVRGTPLGRLSHEQWRRNVIGSYAKALKEEDSRAIVEVSRDEGTPEWLRKMAWEWVENG